MFLQKILHEAKEANVPVVFALSRRQIGQVGALGGRVVSLVAPDVRTLLQCS
jgi:hypothetical protein